MYRLSVWPNNPVLVQQRLPVLPTTRTHVKHRQLWLARDIFEARHKAPYGEVAREWIGRVIAPTKVDRDKVGRGHVVAEYAIERCVAILAIQRGMNIRL